MGVPDGVGEVGRVGVDAQRHRRVRRVRVLQVGLEVPEAAWGVAPYNNRNVSQDDKDAGVLNILRSQAVHVPKMLGRMNVMRLASSSVSLGVAGTPRTIQKPHRA